jgi:hypothetical protein
MSRDVAAQESGTELKSLQAAQEGRSEGEWSMGQQEAPVLTLRARAIIDEIAFLQRKLGALERELCAELGVGDAAPAPPAPEAMGSLSVARRVEQVFRANAGRPLSCEEVMTLARLPEDQKAAVWSALKRLHRRGFTQRAARGRFVLLAAKPL